MEVEWGLGRRRMSGGGEKGASNGDKYDQSTLYTCMKMPQRNPLVWTINTHQVKEILFN
jgi:hypothetical protein